jgi:hypothetical protein
MMKKRDGKMLDNPFTPAFGSIPPLLAGREQIIKDIMSGLDNAPGDPNRSTIFIGARGTGKTVLLAKISEEAATRSWVSANVTAKDGLLDEMIMQIRDNAREFLEPKTLSRITSIQIGVFGFSRTVEKKARRSWRSEMTALTKELNSQNIGLLLTVDEVNIHCEELYDLVDVFQHFVRERRDAALIMAGLPGNVSMVLRDDKISYLRRSFQHRLDPIEEKEVKLALRKTIEAAGRKIKPDALDYAAKNAKGFPFMIQLIGYHIWRQRPERIMISLDETKDGVEFAADDMKRMIFETTIHDLSRKDLEFLIALAQLGTESETAEIAQAMGKTVNYASQYRKRLLEQGVIGERMFGKVDFDIPLLREYILQLVL